MAKRKLVSEVKEERFRPYPGFVSEKERLDAIGACLRWVYVTYSSCDRYLSDFYPVLSGLRVGESSTWGRSVVSSFLEAQSLDELHTLQREVLRQVERIPMEGPKSGISGSPPKELSHSLIVRDDHYVWAYHMPSNINCALISQLVVLRLLNYVDGLHQKALTRCDLCDHVTLRRHPRGKTFCSPQCRWKSAVATRQAKQKQQSPQGG